METSEPKTIFAGAPVAWTKSLPDYPADVWTLIYTFLNAAGKFTVECTASGLDHAAVIEAAASADLVAGVYGWQAKAARVVGAEVLEAAVAGVGTCEVIPDYSAAQTLETRSHARIVLDAIAAVMENRATEDHAAVSVAGRSITKMSHAELQAAEVFWRGRVAAEARTAAIDAGEQPRGRVLIRFPG